MDYAIKDTTLTAIADAVRSKVIGSSELPKYNYTTSINYSGAYSYEVPDCVKKVKIVGVIDFTEYIGGTAVNASGTQGLGIASGYFKSAYGHQVRDAEDFVVIWPGYKANVTNIEKIINFEIEIEPKDNYFTFAGNINSSSCINFKLTFEAIGLDENGNEFKYTPLEMVEAIKGINGVPKEVFDLTTLDISNCFSTGNWEHLLKAYPEQFKLQTTLIDNVSYCFKSCSSLVDLSKLEMAGTSFVSNSPTYFIDAFYGCNNLEHLPTFTTEVDFVATSRIFGNCYRLRELNFTPNFNGVSYYNAPIREKRGMFDGCYSLRKIPGNLFTNSNGYNSTPASYMSNYWFENSCNGCFTLDELLDIPLPTKYTFSTNIFKNFVNYCYRAKDLTFETNEDGTPVVWKFTNQTLDLSTYGNIGTYNKTTITTAILKYNSGITADKEVYDDATYQALKNDDDWFSYSNDYARYNHDSAVRTIASLPDNFATGTNTIKFRGNAGALTDGGAINTLTEEEIAVATAKGWTVSFV